VTRISVTDTGLGIDPEIAERIFNPFVTTKASGTGLGLAKVFSIMENHDGRVECVSEQGAGATFHLYLPADEGEQA
ncbi:MAG TPA: ATP-binding protein, partial [Pseudomonas sp.]|nr:ATP-binding protein [Pseudomonas sp.]